MNPYLLDWLNLVLRWAHIVTGIAWIGSSFYFVSLDNSLTPPKDAKDSEKGVGGEQWGVHGGGFYHHQKYPVSPEKLPEQLHWSMWESYSTWLTGFALFTVLYLFNASSFLIDKSLFDWSPTAAVCTALGFFVGFWLVYDTICRVFGRGPRGDITVGILVFGFVVLASWLSCHLFAGRAAFLLVGAMMATTMSGNVFFWIIPGQRTVVAAIRAGRPVDPVHGQRGKQRSVHNTYFTLPVLFTMMSNHYAFTYGGEHNWLVLVTIMLAGALVRQSFVARHKAHAFGARVPWEYAVAGVVLLVGVVGIGMPPASPPVSAAAAAAEQDISAQPATFAAVQTVLNARCVMCHNGAVAQKGVHLDTPEGIARNAQNAYQQVVVLRQMPFNNATRITDVERALIGRWFAAGAPVQ